MRLILISLSVLLGCLFAYLLVGEVEAVQSVTSEDQFVENLTVLAFLIGLISAVYALSKRRHVLVSSVWLVLCFVFVGEETSWFQRAIGYSVPVIEQRNSQKEFNFHNLDFIHGGETRAFISEDGTLRLGLKHLLTSQSIFRIGFLSYFLILPLLLLLPIGQMLAKRLDMPKFELQHLVTFWGLIALTIPMTLLIDPDRKLAIAESRELIYALAIAVYIFGFAFKMSRTDDIN